jgi:pimeloyl-ACP methyl ester carboxylesterase
MDTHCPDPSIGQYLLAASITNSEGRLGFPFDHSALIQTIEAARDSSVREWVGELLQRGMPILVLRGASSLVWSHEQFQAERAHFAGFPTIDFREIEGAGHGLPFERRQEFIEILEAFISTPNKR